MALAPGCNGIRLDPFALFTRTTIELRDGTDEALSTQYEWARKRYANSIATSGNDSLTAVMLRGLLLDSSEERPFDWVTPGGAPLFVTVLYFQESIREMNEALVRYAWLLEQLAGSGSSTREDFDRIAAEIDESLQDASRALGFQAEPEITIFSTAATLLFYRYLDGKSRNELRRALVANQPTIEEVASRLRGGLALAARHLHHEYQERSFELAASLAPGSDGTTSARRKRVEDLLLLNDLYVQRLRTLRTLDESYRLLPRANQTLLESLSGRETHASAIREIGVRAAFLRTHGSEPKTVIETIDP